LLNAAPTNWNFKFARTAKIFTKNFTNRWQQMSTSGKRGTNIIKIGCDLPKLVTDVSLPPVYVVFTCHGV